MAALSNLKLEAFANSLAKGLKPAQAAREAGYPAGSSFSSNARKRAQRKDVQARVKELRAPFQELAAESVTRTLEAANNAMWEIIEVGLKAKAVRPSDRIMAYKALADVNGWNAPVKGELTLNPVQALLSELDGKTRGLPQAQEA